jgi:protoporphyrinogen oxidase
MKIAVVGGGFTGLACAENLASQGHEVTLFERSQELGGLAAGFRARQWKWSLERFYHHWFASDTHLLKYAKVWGLQQGLRFSQPSTVMQTQNQEFRKLDSAQALLKYPDLTFFNRLRMGCALAYLKITKNWKPLEKVTAQAWCEKWMGKAGYRAIWEPLLRGKFGSDYAAQVNMAWLWARISCRTASLGTFEGGFSEFAKGARKALEAKGVRFELQREISALTRTSSSRWLVSSQQSETKLKHESEYDRVVLATSPLTLHRLLPDLAPAPSTSPYLGAVVVILSVKKELGKHYWYSLRKSENTPFLAAIEHTHFVAPENFNGENILYFADYLSSGHPNWRRTDDQWKSLALSVCKQMNPAFTDADVLDFWVVREPYAQPVPLVHQSQNMPPMHFEKLPGICHASMAHVYPWDRGTNFALELGERVARKVLEGDV